MACFLGETLQVRDECLDLGDALDIALHEDDIPQVVVADEGADVVADMMAVEAKDKVLANFAFGRVMHGRREMLHSNSRTHYIQGA